MIVQHSTFSSVSARSLSAAIGWKENRYVYDVKEQADPKDLWTDPQGRPENLEANIGKLEGEAPPYMTLDLEAVHGDVAEAIGSEDFGTRRQVWELSAMLDRLRDLRPTSKRTLYASPLGVQFWNKGRSWATLSASDGEAVIDSSAWYSRPLAPFVDYWAPSLYTSYPLDTDERIEAHVRHCAARVECARRTGPPLPVIPVVSVVKWASNENDTLALLPLDQLAVTARAMGEARVAGFCLWHASRTWAIYAVFGGRPEWRGYFDALMAGMPNPIDWQAVDASDQDEKVATRNFLRDLSEARCVGAIARVSQEMNA